MDYATNWSWLDMDDSCPVVGWTRIFMHGTSNYREARHLYFQPMFWAEPMGLAGRESCYMGLESGAGLCVRWSTR